MKMYCIMKIIKRMMINIFVIIFFIERISFQTILYLHTLLIYYSDFM